MSDLRHAATFTALSIALLSVVSIGASSTFAGDRCCAACGGCDDCEKCCRLVCEEKKVEITCFGFKCEDFCLPGHSHRGCKHCEMVCEECEEGKPVDPKAPCTKEKKFVWYDWIPGCAEDVCTKRKLQKKTITKKVPTVKWIVEDLCCDCQEKAAEAEAPPPDVKVPAPPAVKAKFIVPQKR